MTKQGEKLNELLGYDRHGAGSEIMYSEIKNVAEQFMSVDYFRAWRSADGVTVEIKGEFKELGERL